MNTRAACEGTSSIPTCEGGFPIAMIGTTFSAVPRAGKATPSASIHNMALLYCHATRGVRSVTLRSVAMFRMHELLDKRSKFRRSHASTLLRSA